MIYGHASELKTSFIHKTAFDIFSSELVEPQVANICRSVAKTGYISSLHIQALDSIVLGMNNSISSAVDVIERC